MNSLPYRPLSSPRPARSGWRRSLGRACVVRLWLALLPGLPVALPAASDLVPVPELGLRIARGFRVTLFADSTLASDIRDMTLDPQGRVVVSGPGYIKTLLDENGDGLADSAILFTAPGDARALCFDGDSLLCVDGDSLLRFTDLDGDGTADDLPEAILPLVSGDAGARALRKGPDGFWVLAGGPGSAFTPRHNSAPHPVLPGADTGAFLRASPDWDRVEILAHGFHGPGGFDFNAIGDLFTFDGDDPGEFLLPWRVQARVFHVARGGHHGWTGRSPETLRPFPESYADIAEPAELAGRARPSATVAYRHYQFPVYYRGGFFMADWESGRVLFASNRPDGAAYEGALEAFLEPLGVHGFTPSALVVATNGALYIATGGFKTRGAVYRVDYAGGNSPPPEPPTPDPAVNYVLLAPQPMEAWSRALWEPAARLTGVDPLLTVVTDETVDPTARVRAIEVLTELFGGLPPVRAQAAARAASPLVRARAAWSAGRVPRENAADILISLAADPDFLVRRCALEGILDQPALADGPGLGRALLLNLAAPDKLLRQLAARAASRLPDVSWQGLLASIEDAGPSLRLAALLARYWRDPSPAGREGLIQSLLEVPVLSNQPQPALDALRLLMLGLGDWSPSRPGEPRHAPYSLSAAPLPKDPLSVRLRGAMRTWILAGPPVNFEAARLLAMLGDNDPQLPATLLSLITPQTDPAADFHFLACLARCPVPAPQLASRIADALLGMDAKLRSGEPRGNWDRHLASLAATLWARDPRVAELASRHARMAAPSHVLMAGAFPGPARATAANQFLVATGHNPAFPWTPELVALIAGLPPAEARPALRQQASNPGLSGAIILKLAAWPEAADRALYLEGLRSPALTVARASLGALLQLPADRAPASLVAPLVFLSRLFSEPDAQDLRPQVIRLLTLSTGHPFLIPEQNLTPAGLRLTYQPVYDWITQQYPETARALAREESDNPATWAAFLRQVNWAAGDPVQGEQIFAARGCLACHGDPEPLGPSMTSLAAKFKPAELILAAAFPSREIPAPFTPTQFQTRDRALHNGFVVYESPHTVLLQSDAFRTERLETWDIVWRRPSTLSLMPSGLLRGLTPAQTASLDTFLRQLAPGARE